MFMTLKIVALFQL